MLTGAIGVGKSKVASYLVEHGYKEYAFARPLKEIAKVLGFSDTEVYGTQEQKLAINPFWGVSGREFLQTFGSEVCRDFLPTVLPTMFRTKQTLWCQLAEKFVQETVAENNDACIVFSDGRFPDEAEFVRRVGGIVIRIERPSLSSSSSTSSSESKAQAHQSEQGASSIQPDCVLVNDGTLAQLAIATITILLNVGPGATTKVPLCVTASSFNTEHIVKSQS